MPPRGRARAARRSGPVGTDLKGTGGLRPRGPPNGVARGNPFAPLRSADSLARARSFHGFVGPATPREI
jgi:hypothetical protein